MKPFDRLLQQWRIAKARRYVPHDSRVLDIGCGNGRLLAQLQPFIREGIGIDPDAPHTVERSSCRLIPGRFPDDLPDVGRFDAITMLAVFEHVPPVDIPRWTRACAELLQPHGLVILTVPSPAVDQIIPVLIRLGMIENIHFEQHHEFDAHSTPALFARDGFEQVCARTFQLGLNHLFVLRKCA